MNVVSAATLFLLSALCKERQPKRFKHNTRSSSNFAKSSSSLEQSTLSRRKIIAKWVQKSSSFIPIAIATEIVHSNADMAMAAAVSQKGEDDVQILHDGYEALSSLLTNWDRATVDCSYADVPRELLEQRNKDELLEKASTFALFDKSSSVVVSCKRTNRIVRDYIGVTGKGPLVNAERRMLRRNLTDRIDPDSLDEYFTACETFSSAMSKAASFSYAAGIADFDSVNNFAKTDNLSTPSSSSGDTSNLEQSRLAVVEARGALGNVVRLLDASISS